MGSRRTFGVLALVTCALSACPRPLPGPDPLPPPPPPPVVVPEGCLDDLSGHWRHDEPSWQYDAVDDGGTLTMTVTRFFTPDAGPSWRKFGRPRDGGPLTDAGPPSDAGTPLDVGPRTVATVTLNRTPRGFVGEANATVTHPVGRACPGRWKTEITSCRDGGLWLRSESEVALGEGCEPPANPQPPIALEHHLTRAPSATAHPEAAPAVDAGTPAPRENLPPPTTP